MKFLYNDVAQDKRILSKLATDLNKIWYEAVKVNAKEVEGMDKLVKDLIDVAKEAERVYSKYALKK